MPRRRRFLSLLLAGLLAACGDGAPERPRAEAANGGREPHQEEAPPAAGGVWFEPLLRWPYVPRVGVQICLLPEGSGFFILGRDGQVFFYGSIGMVLDPGYAENRTATGADAPRNPASSACRRGER